MTNFSDMLSKAKAMQEKMKEAQDQIKKIEVEGEAGGNLVKVILSGDGADEIFLWYNRHKWLYKFDRLNKFQKKIFYYLLSNIGQKNLLSLYNFLHYFVPSTTFLSPID